MAAKSTSAKADGNASSQGANKVRNKREREAVSAGGHAKRPGDGVDDSAQPTRGGKRRKLDKDQTIEDALEDSGRAQDPIPEQDMVINKKWREDETGNGNVYLVAKAGQPPESADWQWPENVDRQLVRDHRDANRRMEEIEHQVDNGIFFDLRIFDRPARRRDSAGEVPSSPKSPKS